MAIEKKSLIANREAIRKAIIATHRAVPEKDTVKSNARSAVKSGARSAVRSGARSAVSSKQAL